MLWLHIAGSSCEWYCSSRHARDAMYDGHSFEHWPLALPVQLMSLATEFEGRNSGDLVFGHLLPHDQRARAVRLSLSTVNMYYLGTYRGIPCNST